MIIDRIRSLSIHTKLLFLIVFFLLLPFLLLGTLWYKLSAETGRENAVQTSAQLVDQINGRLNSYFSDIERSTLQVVTNPLVSDYFNTAQEDSYQRFKATQKLETDLLPAVNYNWPDILQISIVNRNGTMASYGNFSVRERNEELAQKFRYDTNYKIIGISTTMEKIPVLTIVRNFRNPQTYQPQGLIIFDVNMNKIAAAFSGIKIGEAGFIWLIDESGHIVYHPDRDKWGDPAPAFYLQPLDPDKPVYRDVDGVKKMILVRRSEQTGWTMVTEIPYDQLIGKMSQMRNLTIWIGSGLALFVLLAVSAFSFNLVRSVSLLQRLMKRAENGDLNVKAPEKRKDEIGGLNRSFNKMVEEIRRLIEVVHTSRIKEKEMQIKQRESSLRAMQSQINPHFLYNTLEVINSYAIVEDVMPISRMATALADIFRYSVGDPRQVVTLEDELNHITTYFEIQKERYRYLNVEITISPDIAKRVQGVRLMLQPLVENAFIHGYERHRLKPEYVGIVGEACEDCYCVRVIDHGKGMEPDQLERYNRLFTGYAEDAAASDFSESSRPARRIGLLNVHERLLLTFGEPCGLTIVRSDGQGTEIELKLPYVHTETLT